MRPHHLGVILDGGTRWADANGTSAAEAYRRSCVKQLEVVGWCRTEGVAEVTLFVPPPSASLSDEQMDAVWSQVLDGLRQSRSGAPAATLKHIGDPAQLPAGVAANLRSCAERATADGSGFTVNLVLGYEGRSEILGALRSILLSARDEGRSLAETISRLDTEQLGANLSTGTLPPLDLVIRTAGHRHLSGFLPWHAAYAEYHFTAACAPEFTWGDLTAALADYSRRNRRFGK